MKNSIRIVVLFASLFAGVALLAIPFSSSLASPAPSAVAPEAAPEAPARVPTVVMVEVVEIVASRPAKRVSKRSRAKTQAAFVHALAQGGSPDAPSVRVFGVAR